MATAYGREFEDLLSLLKETRGFDFTGYRRSTLERRIRRRMEAAGVATYADYRDYLEVEPDEYGLLFDNLLIHVTGFFRDPAAWRALQDKILPELLSAKASHGPIRVWSAGCSTGEEAYTLAMVLAERLGVEQFCERVKIYATDRDEKALRHARVATYDARTLEDVPAELREKYFEPGESTRSFRRDLRRSLIFGRIDLTRDAPISRVDVLCARNTLMYFSTEVQAEILHRFHFALADPGFLFLGRAEMLLNQEDRFEPVDLRLRLFRKGARRAYPFAELPWREGHEDHIDAWRLERASLDTVPVAQLVVDTDGTLAVVNERARALFGLRQRDVGRPFHDLEISYRPVELRSLIEQVTAEGHAVDLQDVSWRRVPSDPTLVLDVTVAPLHNPSGGLIGAAISFIDVTRYHDLRAKLEHTHGQLERAYEELQSTNEELETTNEELQSTNEELETTNEELQSTSEEMETMNEELQSSNDELQEINTALRTRTDKLDHTNAVLESVLDSLGGAVVVLDETLQVKMWTPGAERLWGLRAEEVEDRHLLSLNFGLPVQDLFAHLRGMVAEQARGTVTKSLDAVDRRGEDQRLDMSATLLRNRDDVVTGVIVVLNPVSE